MTGGNKDKGEDKIFEFFEKFYPLKIFSYPVLKNCFLDVIKSYDLQWVIQKYEHIQKIEHFFIMDKIKKTLKDFIFWSLKILRVGLLPYQQKGGVSKILRKLFGRNVESKSKSNKNQNIIKKLVRLLRPSSKPEVIIEENDFFSLESLLEHPVYKVLMYTWHPFDKKLEILKAEIEKKKNAANENNERLLSEQSLPYTDLSFEEKNKYEEQIKEMEKASEVKILKEIDEKLKVEITDSGILDDNDLKLLYKPFQKFLSFIALGPYLTYSKITKNLDKEYKELVSECVDYHKKEITSKKVSIGKDFAEIKKNLEAIEAALEVLSDGPVMSGSSDHFSHELELALNKYPTIMRCIESENIVQFKIKEIEAKIHYLRIKSQKQSSTEHITKEDKKDFLKILLHLYEAFCWRTLKVMCRSDINCDGDGDGGSLLQKVLEVKK